MRIVYYIRMEEETDHLRQFQTVLRMVKILESIRTSSGQKILVLQFVDDPTRIIYTTPDELHNEYGIEQVAMTYSALLICEAHTGLSSED